ncbi:hypothetical protein BGZ54_003438 [Gamsiella multidivaricata]|nr:hypothetical protein BGZ54_003438 [Gamsiella multidivaricata]
MATCPNFDLEETDPSQFFDGHSITWKRHYIGWGIAGFCALVSTLISFRLLYKHARNYNKPSEQRHIMRIVLMIPIYSIISFLSYRFYKQAIYYETIRDCYEAFVIHSFFVLLLTYLGDDTAERRARITAGPERRKLIFPLNCFYYKPHGELFLHWMKYGVLQYVVVKPVTTIAAVILQYKDLYCDTTYSFQFGKVYITIVNFISVTVAMYCLVIFYMTIKTEIADKSVFEATEYWSISNIEIGISALLICVEMVAFAIMHVFSFSYTPYVIPNVKTPVRKSLRDGFNPVDMVTEVGWACKDIVLIIMGRPLPIRDGHLSGAVKRANTVRTRNRVFKSRKSGGGSTASDNDPSFMTAVDDASLEAGGKFVSSEAVDPNQQAPLLSNVDDARINNHYGNSYEMSASPQPTPYATQQEQLQLQLQQQQQQQQHQQMLQQQQQFQQQQAYASRPADGYQY